MGLEIIFLVLTRIRHKYCAERDIGGANHPSVDTLTQIQHDTVDTLTQIQYEILTKSTPLVEEILKKSTNKMYLSPAQNLRLPQAPRG